jgi:hypothetical protein
MNSPMNDLQLRRALKHWSPEATLNPQFRSAVWARIDAARGAPQTWGAWLRGHLLPVSSLAAVAFAAAILVGQQAASQTAAQQRQQLLQDYIVSINPHQQLAQHSP